MALADVDLDGDLDLALGMLHGGTRVWLNDGAGAFVDSGLRLGPAAMHHVQWADLDGDGYPELITLGDRAGGRVVEPAALSSAARSAGGARRPHSPAAEGAPARSSWIAPAIRWRSLSSTSCAASETCTPTACPSTVVPATRPRAGSLPRQP